MHHLHDVHPEDFGTLTSAQLRDRFLVSQLFIPGQQCMTYWDVDRTVVGGIMPTETPLSLDIPVSLAADSFCERRELGIINLGGAGTVTAGEQQFTLAPRDGLYLGRGSRTPVLASVNPALPARFYLLSYPAHAAYPATHIQFEKIAGLSLGDSTTGNARTLFKYIAPGLVESCQLVMGFTAISEGSVWNTMPPHTHARRSEVYCYCDLAPESIVMHFMGPPDATRNLVVRGGEAVVSPSWSIHAGAGTGAYSFVWGMGGENQDFDDMDKSALSELC